MSGSTPFTARSPTQSNQYPPYSPTHQNRPFFGHEPYQIPPQHLIQTPPFQPVSLAQSPHLSRAPIQPSPLPVPNVLPPPPPSIGTAPQYQPPMTSSPPYALQRTYSGHSFAPTMSSQYDSIPTHAHPLAPVSAGLSSPARDLHHLSNGRPADHPPSEPRPQSKDVGVHPRLVS